MYDTYERKIMSLLRRDHTKTYTKEQIRVDLVGTRFSWIERGYTPFDYDRECTKVDDALRHLVQKNKVYKKEDGSGKAVYGIRMSRVESIKLKISRPGAGRRIRRSRMSLDRRVKGIHRNWLTIIITVIVGVFVPIIIAVII